MYICVKDGRTLQTVLNGAYAEERLDGGEPYKLWATDILACPVCGFRLAVTASEPLVEHFDPDYWGVVERASQTRGGLLKGGFSQS